jgi:hypothetical protein
MVDYKTILKGEMFFFIGFILILIINSLLPPLIEAGESIGTVGSDIEQIIWFGGIILYVLAGVIMPLGYMYKGLTTDTGGNPFQNITIALVMFLFNLLLTIKAWYMVTALASLSSDGFITAIFWIGFTLTWLVCVIVTPAYVIIKNTQQQ